MLTVQRRSHFAGNLFVSTTALVKN